MKLTGATFREPKGKSKVIAFCNLYFDNILRIYDVRIIDGANGPFLSMPSIKDSKPQPDGKFKYFDVVKLDRDFNDELSKEVYALYLKDKEGNKEPF